MKITNSIVVRTSLLYALLTATVVLLMGVIIRISVGNHFIVIDNQQMQGKLELIQHLLGESPTPQALPPILQQLNNALIGHHDLTVQIQDPSSALIFNTQTTQPSLTTNHTSNLHKTAPLDTVLTRTLVTTTASGYRITVTLDISQHQKFLNAFEWYLMGIGTAGTFTMALLGWFVSNRGLRPVHEMAQLAANISAQQLSERLPITSLPVELHSLALSFNAMLDRLADSLQRLTEFSSDIAHELRTPINNLMTQTQVSLTKRREADAYREILYNNLEEYERLARMISDMLFLAKSDHGLVIPHPEFVNLRQEFCAVCDFFEALAADRHITFSILGDASIQGDKSMLRRAMGNLISNAIRYSYANTTIKIELHTFQTEVTVSVENTGDAIPDNQLPRLFERFYRTDSSRQHHHEGAGLGLAITQSIIKAHGGDITISSSKSNTQFLIRLKSHV